MSRRMPSVFFGHGDPMNALLKMYGPPLNCKKNWSGREQSAKMYPASSGE
jgi:hypothetical protein